MVHHLRRSLLTPPAQFRGSRRVLTRPDPPLQLIRHQQVSGSSPLADSNQAFIERAASDPMLMVAIVFLSSISAIIFLRALVIRGLVTQSVRRVTIRNPSF